MSKRVAGRWVLILVVALPLLVLGAQASASASDPFANYITKVTQISPALPGVRARTPENGADMVISNSSSRAVIVLGYQGEPYLRITDQGVWQNERSPATYLNKEYYIDSIPTTVDAHRKPQWKLLNGGDRAVWHDHRIHWMGAIQPPSVAKDPHHSHLIKSWKVGLRYGGERANVLGTLSWRPTGHLGSYLTYGGLGAAVMLALGLLTFSARRRRLHAGNPGDHIKTDLPDQPLY